MKYFNEENWSGDPNDMYFAFDNHLVSRSVKIFADGALRTGGAAVSYGDFFHQTVLSPVARRRRMTRTTSGAGFNDFGSQKKGQGC